MSQQNKGSKKKGGNTASKTPRDRFNKIYRAPPTPPPEELLAKEKGFVSDTNAVSSISSDYSKANPKLGPVIPPYNAQVDKNCDNYFHFIGVDKTLKKTGQKVPEGTSIEGRDIDRFHESGSGHVYLSLRNQFGAGHSRDEIDGHGQFMKGIKECYSYNGRFGYRRNTPLLRQSPSPFGTASTSPTH